MGLGAVYVGWPCRRITVLDLATIATMGFRLLWELSGHHGWCVVHTRVTANKAQHTYRYVYVLGACALTPIVWEFEKFYTIKGYDILHCAHCSLAPPCLSLSHTSPSRNCQGPLLTPSLSLACARPSEKTRL